MPDLTQALRDARDLLLVANRDNPKALGDFGCDRRRQPASQSQNQTRVLNRCSVS